METPTAGGFALRIVVAAAAGFSDVAIAGQLFRLNRHTVNLLAEAFLRRRPWTVCGILPPRRAGDGKPIMKSTRSAALVDATLPNPNRRDDALELPDHAQSQGIGKFDGPAILARSQVCSHIARKTFNCRGSEVSGRR